MSRDAAPKAFARTAAPYAGLVLLCVLAGLFPSLSPSGQMLSVATSAAVFAIAALGMGFLWGQSGQLTLAHAAVFGLGAYAAAIASKHYGLGFAASLPISIVVGLLAGALVALPSLRTSGHYFVILTFAIGEVLAVAEMRLDSITGGANGMLIQIGDKTFLGIRLADRGQYYSMLIGFAALILVLLRFLMRSRWGIILRGIRENSDLALSLGVNVAWHRVFVFALSGAIAGLAGQLYLYQVRFIAPILFTSEASIVFLLVVLLGGKAYLLGPAIGAMVYFFLPEFIHLSPIQSQIAFGVVLMVTILLVPNGLLSLIDRFRKRLVRRPAGAQRLMP